MADDPLKETKRIMGALGRMPPKPHKEMKVGKPKEKKKVSPAPRKKAKT
jgi:hypothetical protein